MRFFFFIFAALSLCPTLAAADVCATPRTTDDVLSCIEANHPDIKKTASDVMLIDGVVKAANQIPNPTLLLETNTGSSLGDTYGEDTIAVSQLLEIGGKRAARRKNGEAQAQVIRAGSLLLKAQTRMDALLKMIRYRQVLVEIAVLDEALTTYEKVQRQFQSRPRLSPEQQTTLGIFKLAMGDYRNKQADLQAEKRRVETYFRLVPELNFAEAVKLLPKLPKKWPKVGAPPADVTNNPRIRLADSELKQSEAASDLASAFAWPDPTVTFLTVREVAGAAEFQRYGVGVTFPIPVWNLNRGERQQASALKTKAAIEYKRSLLSYSFERQNLVGNYEAFVIALEKSPIDKSLDATHRNTEAFFYRGVISGVMVIEAHRQILEFTTTQNELELETVQTLANINFLDGRLQDFKYE